jgi:ABC-2 type transport system ATP-binding protein
VGVLAEGELVALDTPAGLVADHGGETRLLVGTDAGSIPGYDAEPTDRGLVIRDLQPGDISGVVDALAAAGVTYDALSWSESDLETAYLTLTGQTPRSAGEIPAVDESPDGQDEAIASGGGT